MPITTSTPQQRAVLSGILSCKVPNVAIKRMAFVATASKVEHYTEANELIFRAMLIYFRTVGGVINHEHFVDLIKRRGLEEIEFTGAVSQFIELRDLPAIEENEFRFQVSRLIEVTKSDRLVDALTDTMDVLMSGKKINNKLVQGYDGALAVVSKRLAELARDEASSSPVLMNKDMSRVLTNYADRKFGRHISYKTDFGEIDTVTSGGFQAGDLVFLAGYTSEGKTTLLRTLVDGWVFGSKLNVVIGTAENTPSAIQRMMVATRSADPKYGMALDYKAIKEGKLGHIEEKTLERIVADMANNEQYGKFAIFTIPTNSTATSVFEIVKMYNQIFPVHIFAWDYCGYSGSETRRNTDREEMGHVVRAAKVLSTSFDNGRGIATISPFQVARGRWEKAVQAGFYTLACMEETSAAEKAADIVISVLNLPEQNKTVAQVLKNRDGPRFSTPFELQFDSAGMRFKPHAMNVSL